CRNLEWLSVAGAFTSRMVASIATANSSVPITPQPILIACETPLSVRLQNGATAAARRAITFSIGPRCWVKCECALIWLTSAKPLRLSKKPHHHNQVQRTRLRLVPRRLQPMLRPYRQTPRPNKMPSLPCNHLLHQHLLRRRLQPMLRPRRRTPPNKMPSLPHNQLLRRHLHRPRKRPQLLRPRRRLRNPRCPIPLPGTTNISMRPAV